MKFWCILLLILPVVPMQAQQSADTIVAEIYHFLAQRDSVGNDNCVGYADDWVAMLPQEKLSEYVRQAERILYPPYSSYCNRMTYRSLLEKLLQGNTDDIALLRYKYQYEMLSRNNEGDYATDFGYYDAIGEKHCLFDSRGTRTLLIFNDPECEECAMLREQIITNGEIAGFAIDSTTTVLLVYPDEPTEAWRNAVSHYPETWIVGYSEDVSDIYDLRTLPSTYLLDENYRIILRDAH